jgi:DNA-binding winged helix-turn-helix (wHTH) protein/Tfp pilus assembly protein PilF
MNETTSPDTVFVFGAFRFDPARGALTCEGAPVVLTARLRDTLRSLLENAGRLVTKDELLQALWPGRIADETNLSQAISGLRKALGPKGEGMILTEPGRGYRLGVPVERTTSGELTGGLSGARAARVPRWAMLAAIAGALGCAAIVAIASLGPWPSRRAPADGVRVVLANFQNFTHDAAFDHVMDKALEADLAQSPYLIITPDSKIAETLGLMGLARDAPLTADRAREVCERNNGGAVIAGAVGQLGAQYLITLTSSDCASGRILDEQKQEAAGKEAVAVAVDRLAERIRRKLGESDASITRFDVPLMAERTGSFEALRAYSEGLWLHDHGGLVEAISQYAHAIETDPNFAMAYARLSTTYFNLRQPVEDQKYITIAYGLRNQVSEPERFYISERYQQSVTRNTEEGLRILHEWTGVYPRDSRAWVNLSNQANGIGRYAEATAAARRAFDLGEHTGPSYYALITDDAKTNHLAQAQALGEEAMAKGVGGGAVLGETMRIASLRHDEATVQRLMDQARGKPAERDALAAASDIALAKGRRREAFALLDQAAVLGRDQNVESEGAAERALALALFGLSGDARTILAASTPNLDPQDFLYAMASVGDAGRAESELEKDLKASPSDTLLNQQFAPEIRAVIALRRGRPDEAERLLAPASPYALRNFDTPYLQGEILLAAKNPVGAARAFQRVLANPGLGPDPQYALSHLGLARALSAQGLHDQAKREYETFLAAWKDADADLPILIAARSEYASLGGAATH